MAGEKEFLRFASPNEQRMISRENLGFYHAVIVGASYDFADGLLVDTPRLFLHPLKRCIEQHPYLCVVVSDTHTDKPFYQRALDINLEEHVSIVNPPKAGDGELATIEKVLEPILDQPFPQGIPPWRIVVLPLQQSQCFIAFAFSHAIGDGASGTAFHRTFLDACNDTSNVESPVSSVIRTPVRPLPAPFDTPQRLPISWSFLLAPLLGSILPRYIADLLGLPQSAATVDAGTWTGCHIAKEPKARHSRIKLREIEAPLLKNALRAARKHDAKLTGIIHQLLTRALSKAIPDPKVTNFVSQTAINMRGSIGMSNKEMGNCVSGCYIVHPRANPSKPLSEEDWAAARSATWKLAECASTLQDQAVGLLRYVSGVRKWTLGKLGQRRECSFEVSNIGVFDSSQEDSTGSQIRSKISKMVFAQPGQVLSSPIAFNFVSVKGCGLVYTVTWEAGALGILEAHEEQFVGDICATLSADFENLHVDN